MVVRQNKVLMTSKTRRFDGDKFIPFGIKDQQKVKMVKMLDEVYDLGYDAAIEDYETDFPRKKLFVTVLMLVTFLIGVMIGVMI